MAVRGRDYDTSVWSQQSRTNTDELRVRKTNPQPHLSLSATKMTLRSSSREAKTLMTWRTLRQLNRLSKSTCSSLESLGRLSSMTWYTKREEEEKKMTSSHILDLIPEKSVQKRVAIFQGWSRVWRVFLLSAALTSFPAPGRKVLTLISFPGAGNGDSMRLLMKG